MTLTMGRENLPKNGTSSNAPGRELCYKEKWPEVRIHTDSWAIANGLAKVRVFKEKDCTSRGK